MIGIRLRDVCVKEAGHVWPRPLTMQIYHQNQQ